MISEDKLKKNSKLNKINYKVSQWVYNPSSPWWSIWRLWYTLHVGPAPSRSSAHSLDTLLYTLLSYVSPTKWDQSIVVVRWAVGNHLDRRVQIARLTGSHHLMRSVSREHMDDIDFSLPHDEWLLLHACYTCNYNSDMRFVFVHRRLNVKVLWENWKILWKKRLILYV